MFSLSSFYRSEEWARFRKTVIDERTAADGIVYDEETGKPIIKAYDIIAHHIEPLTEQNVNNPEVALNADNIMLVSHATHNRLHMRFGYQGTRHIYLVYGAPCAGKSEYVLSVAGPNDIILEIDRIYACISNSPLHIKSDKLRRNVFIIRDEILDMIKTRTGAFENAYVIGGYPLASERQRLAEVLGAELIFIERAKDECLERAEGVLDENYEKYINEWFEKFEIR